MFCSSSEVCQAIKESLDSTNQRYVLSRKVTLEDCLMALDMDNGAMDRGAIVVDGIGIWDWRDRLVSSVHSIAVDRELFAAATGCLFVKWMCGGCVAQDSLLCNVPFVRPDINDDLRLVCGAFWFLVTAVCEEISAANFSKDESMVSRNFHGVRYFRYEPVTTGIVWLDALQTYFKEKQWRLSFATIPTIPVHTLDLAQFKGIIEPLMSNTYGIGCCRNTRIDLDVPAANRYLLKLESQFKDVCYSHGVMSDNILSLTEVAVSLSTLTDTLQIVRASALNYYFSSVLALASPFWTASGGLSSHSEYQLVSDGFHCLLHSKPRLHRLIPKWLAAYSNTCIADPSSTFLGFLWFMKTRWIRIGLELGLYSEYEKQEAEDWIVFLADPHSNSAPTSSYKRFQYRWRPLINIVYCSL